MVPSGPPLSILGTECSDCKPAPLVVPQTIGEHQPLPCAADTSKLPPISPILCQGAQQLITPVTHARRTRSTLENAVFKGTFSIVYNDEAIKLAEDSCSVLRGFCAHFRRLPHIVSHNPVLKEKLKAANRLSSGNIDSNLEAMVRRGDSQAEALASEIVAVLSYLLDCFATPSSLVIPPPTMFEKIKSSIPQKSNQAKGEPVNLELLLSERVDTDVLDLHSRNLSDADLTTLASLLSSSPPHDVPIRMLNLHSNRLTNASLPHLKSILSTLTSLRAIDLSHNKFKGAPLLNGIKNLVTQHPTLRYLAYLNNSPGPDGLDQLYKMFKDSPVLREVDLGWKSLSKDDPATAVTDVPDRPLSPSTSSGVAPFPSSSSSSTGLVSPPLEDHHMIWPSAVDIAAQASIGACKSVLVSPNRRDITKFKGGNKHNANLQWEPMVSTTDPQAFRYAIRLQCVKPDDEIYVGWAPRGMEANALDEYQKSGAYLSRNGVILCPQGKPVKTLALSAARSTGFGFMRTTYHPAQSSIIYEASHNGSAWELLCTYENMPAEPVMIPTIAFHHQGSRISLLDSPIHLIPYNKEKHSWKSIWQHGH